MVLGMYDVWQSRSHILTKAHRSTFGFQIGIPGQVVRLLPSTAAYNTWTVDADIGCPSQAGSNCVKTRGGTFKSESSLTWLNNSIYSNQLESKLGIDITAYYGWDTVTLGWPDAAQPPPAVQHSVMQNYADAKYWTGMFGLNPRPTNFSTLASPQESIMGLLKNNNTIPSLSWSYTAGNQYRRFRSVCSEKQLLTCHPLQV